MIGPNNSEHVSEVLEKVRKIGTTAGYELVVDESGDLLVAPFIMPDGRAQTVYIQYRGQTPDGKDIISFLSPCLEIKSGILKGLRKNQAVDLLRRNSNLFFGHFGLFEFRGAEVVMSSSSQILETMDDEEFQVHINYVATVADSYEREVGQDRF